MTCSDSKKGDTKASLGDDTIESRGTSSVSSIGVVWRVSWDSRDGPLGGLRPLHGPIGPFESSTIRATGFEPATCGSQSRRSTKLSYTLYGVQMVPSCRRNPVLGRVFPHDSLR